MNNNQISQVINIMAKHGFDVTRKDIEHAMNGEYYSGVIWQEECDCYEKHGRVLHNNGGNYHQMVYIKSFGDGYALIDSDTSDSFGMDGEELYFVNRETQSYDSILGHWADDKDYDDCDFCLNARRDSVLGIVL